MSAPGRASVTPLLFLARAKQGSFNLCLHLALSLSFHSFYRKVKGGRFKPMCVPDFPPAAVIFFHLLQVKGGGLKICLYMAFLPAAVVCLYLLQGDRLLFNKCLYLTFPLLAGMSLSLSQGEPVAILTYVCTWLFPCHFIPLYTSM